MSGTRTGCACGIVRSTTSTIFARFRPNSHHSKGRAAFRMVAVCELGEIAQIAWKLDVNVESGNVANQPVNYLVPCTLQSSRCRACAIRAVITTSTILILRDFAQTATCTIPKRPFEWWRFVRIRANIAEVGLKMHIRCRPVCTLPCNHHTEG